jgi:hypothetical protein
MAKLFDWGDGKGKVHTKSKADHNKTVSDNKAAANRVVDPPSGYYDPNLDVQQRDEKRAYGRNVTDLNLAAERAGVDLGFQTKRTGNEPGSEGIDRVRSKQDYDTGVSGVERGFGRSLSDLLQARSRGGEDYQSSLTNLQRSYDRLGNQQGELSRKMGAEATGGVYAQAARKRAENQAIDKSPIDQAYSRFTQDSATSEGRLGEDRKLSLDELLRGYNRAGEDMDWTQGQAARGYSNAATDIGTALERGETDHTNFGQDIRAAKQFQWGGQAITGTGAPASTIKAPAATQPATPTSSPAPTSITAAPGVKGVKKTTRRAGKNRVVTYSNSVGGP